MGLVLGPPRSAGWWKSHAANPVVLGRSDGLVDVYFSARDARNRSNLARVTILISESGARLASLVEGPLIEPGPRGAFDADGVTLGCILPVAGRLFAYYLGWTLGVGVPFTNAIGLAISDDGGRTFRKSGRAPIVGRSEQNPFTLGYPWVVRDSAHYRMWFGSHLSWGPDRHDMEHVIKEAVSEDGLAWKPLDRVAVPLDRSCDPSEFAVSRPVVLQENDGSYSMWYARRHPGYSIGFARSSDNGVSWTRDDAAVEFLGERGPWEATERTYPCVFDHAGGRYMFYNGDDYGRTGFGIAKLVTC